MNTNTKKIILLVGLLAVWLISSFFMNMSKGSSRNKENKEQTTIEKNSEKSVNESVGGLDWYYERQNMQLEIKKDIFTKEIFKPVVEKIITKQAVKVVEKKVIPAVIITPQVIKPPEPEPVIEPARVKSDEELILDELSKVLIIGYIQNSTGSKVFFKYDGRTYEAGGDAIFKVSTEKGTFDIKTRVTPEGFLQMIEERNNISVKKRIRGDK